MQCYILDQFIFDQTNLQHVLTYDYSSMILLLAQFKYVADLHTDTTYRFGDKQSVEYLYKQVSINNEDEFIFTDLLDKVIKQMDMALDFVTGLKTRATTVFVYDEQDVIHDVPCGKSICDIGILMIVVLVYITEFNFKRIWAVTR